MPIQQMTMYTAKGYAGALVDSAPSMIQTGVAADDTVKAGLCVTHKPTYAPNGIVAGVVRIPNIAEVYAEGISLRDYDLEAGEVPAKGGDWHHKQGRPINVLREGFCYVTLAGSTSVQAGSPLYSEVHTGEFAGSGALKLANVYSMESGSPMDVIKVRIDHSHDK